MGGLLRKLHPVLHSSLRCRVAIKEVPVVAFRGRKCLSDYLFRARFSSDSKEEVTGTSKCGSNRCQICNFLRVGRTFRSKTNGKEFSINYNLNCNSKNVVYLITCKICGIQYVGSTTSTFRFRFNNHRSRINAHLNLSSENKRNDDFLHRHFHSSRHLRLKHVSIQLTDRAIGEREYALLTYGNMPVQPRLRVKILLKFKYENIVWLAFQKNLYSKTRLDGHITIREKSVLEEKEGHWMYRLGTLRPQGRFEDDGFNAQNRKTRVGARRR